MLTSILLVDDNKTTNFLNQLLLTKLQVASQILVAEDGEQALRTLVKHCMGSDTAACPQLIFLDMNMPVLNGLGFLEAYAQLPHVLPHPVIIVMLTTSMHPKDLERAQQLPIASFLHKPLTEEKVTALLAQYFPTSGISPSAGEEGVE